jgi:carbonic anhydrase
MDARLDLLEGFGLRLGDAHVIRNAGGIPTDDVLRSLAISQRLLGTREVLIVHHTQCGMDGFDDAAFRRDLSAESGAAPPWDVPGFSDLVEDVRRSAQTVRECPWLPHRQEVRGVVYDNANGKLIPVG